MRYGDAESLITNVTEGLSKRGKVPRRLQRMKSKEEETGRPSPAQWKSPEMIIGVGNCQVDA
jgi:hypothetical protein